VFESLRAQGIGVNLHYIPIHTQPYYQKMGYKTYEYPQAMSYYAEAISIPIYVNLSKEQQDIIITALKNELIGVKNDSN
jgi:dTDP-4-amino-4,6-dideoxygalactose transaminase